MHSHVKKYEGGEGNMGVSHCHNYTIWPSTHVSARAQIHANCHFKRTLLGRDLFSSFFKNAELQGEVERLARMDMLAWRPTYDQLTEERKFAFYISINPSVLTPV
jgi:hypothetical protein